MFDRTQAQPYMAQPGGYVYNGYNAAPQAKVMNVLTAEEIKELQQERSQFSLGLTAREAKQAACNHRSADGMSDSLVFDQDTGKARCQICGYEFRPIEPDTSYEDIMDAADRCVDILQTIKLLYTDLPADAAREYFQIIPMIAKIPQLFEFAAKSFSKHEFNNAWAYQNSNMSGMAMLQGLSSIFGASQQPNYGMPQYGMPQQAPFMAQPQTAPMGNPFGYAGASEAAPTGYQPQVQGYQYVPGAVPPAAPQPTAQAPAAPAAPAAAPTETVTQKVNV